MAVSRSRINLAWSDNSSDEAGFLIERSLDGKTWTQIAIVGANVRNYSATGLAAFTTCYFRVRAYTGSLYSAYSNVAGARTKRKI